MPPNKPAELTDGYIKLGRMKEIVKLHVHKNIDLRLLDFFIFEFKSPSTSI